MNEQIATRRLRVIKYRGSMHGLNEYPFLIENDGISILPITSLGLDHPASNERVSTGIMRLDAMLDGKGFYRGTSNLISGTAGTGKTSFAAHFAADACSRGERCLYFAFEESPAQIARNMGSIGIDFQNCIDSGLLKIRSSRPMVYGLESHLVEMMRSINDYQPMIVIIDPISNLTNIGIESDVKFMLTRLVDFMKTKGITAVCTSLVDREDNVQEQTAQGISSLMDSWIKLSFVENSSERNRSLSVIKSRGIAHSNQIREFQITDQGIKIMDVYLGQACGLIMGSSRAVQEAREKEEAAAYRQEAERKKRELENRLRSLNAQVASLQSEIDADKMELDKIIKEEGLGLESRDQSRMEMARIRKADDILRSGREK